MILTSKVLSIDIDPNQHIDLFSNKDKKYKELEKHVGCFYNGKHIKKIKSCTFQDDQLKNVTLLPTLPDFSCQIVKFTMFYRESEIVGIQLNYNNGKILTFAKLQNLEEVDKKELTMCNLIGIEPIYCRHQDLYAFKLYYYNENQVKQSFSQKNTNMSKIEENKKNSQKICSKKFYNKDPFKDDKKFDILLENFMTPIVDQSSKFIINPKQEQQNKNEEKQFKLKMQNFIKNSVEDEILYKENGKKKNLNMNLRGMVKTNNLLFDDLTLNDKINDKINDLENINGKYNLPIVNEQNDKYNLPIVNEQNSKYNLPIVNEQNEQNEWINLKQNKNEKKDLLNEEYSCDSEELN